jgi:hypothetical protein
MHDDELISRYRARGVPTDWQELTPDQMRPAFRLFYRALPSPSIETEGSADAEQLIHDPLSALRAAGILSADAEAPSISTFVVNHEETLYRYVMHASVAVSTNPHTVGITIVKEAEPTEEYEGEPPKAAS